MIIEKGAIVSKAAERSEFEKNVNLIHKKSRYLKMDETVERIHNAIDKKREKCGKLNINIAFREQVIVKINGKE